MIGTNPFAIVSEFVSPLAMQIYVVLMFAPVIVGTLLDVANGSGMNCEKWRERAGPGRRRKIPC